MLVYGIALNLYISLLFLIHLKYFFSYAMEEKCWNSEFFVRRLFSSSSFFRFTKNRFYSVYCEFIVMAKMQMCLFRNNFFFASMKNALRDGRMKTLWSSSSKFKVPCLLFSCSFRWLPKTWDIVSTLLKTNRLLSRSFQSTLIENANFNSGLSQVQLGIPNSPYQVQECQQIPRIDCGAASSQTKATKLNARELFTDIFPSRWFVCSKCCV